MRTLDPIKHEQKRQEILAAAMRCFVRDGFRGASITDICAESKTSPGNLYHYFESKEAIVAAMAATGLKLLAAHFSKVVESPDALETILSQIERAKNRQERGGLVFLLDLLAEAGRNPSIANILQEHSLAIRSLLADFLRKGQASGKIDGGLDPEATAAILIGIVDGARIAAIRDPKIDMVKSVEHLKVLIARFLKSPE